MLYEYLGRESVTYCVQFTEKNNDGIYVQEWDYANVTAMNGKQAIEFLKDEIKENGYNSENYIYTIMRIEDVPLFWSNEIVKVYMNQKPIFDEETGYLMFKTEDGRWIAQDDAIGEWIQIRG